MMWRLIVLLLATHALALGVALASFDGVVTLILGSIYILTSLVLLPMSVVELMD